MATNVTEKDRTLREVIEWLGRKVDEAYEAKERCVDYQYNDGRFDAFQQTINHCQDMLGYSSQIPSEVPNQSEGAEISNREELTELVARKLWLEWNCELEGIDKTADDWAKLDSGTVFDKATAEGWRNVAWQILEGLRRYKVRKYKKWREERGLGKTTNEMTIDR